MTSSSHSAVWVKAPSVERVFAVSMLPPTVNSKVEVPPATAPGVWVLPGRTTVGHSRTVSTVFPNAAFGVVGFVAALASTARNWAAVFTLAQLCFITMILTGLNHTIVIDDLMVASAQPLPSGSRQKTTVCVPGTWLLSRARYSKSPMAPVS